MKHVYTEMLLSSPTIHSYFIQIAYFDWLLGQHKIKKKSLLRNHKEEELKLGMHA